MEKIEMKEVAKSIRQAVDEYIRQLECLNDYINSLEQQLAEKDKEIERLKYQLLYSQVQAPKEEIDNFNNIMLAQRRPYEELEGKSLYEISQIYQNQIRNKICDEIREKAEIFGAGPIGKIGYLIKDELLDKIEKGE